MTPTSLEKPKTYDDLVSQFDWSLAEADLGYRRGDPINIGWYCSDRICRLGLAAKSALIWADAQGATRTYTFDDLRQSSNTIAAYLARRDLVAGEPICLFMDRVPELYIGLLGILKLGGIAQPLFSAFGEESLWTRLDDAGTVAILTQKKHLPKVRRIRARLPGLRHVIVVDALAGSLQEGEFALALDAEPRVDCYDAYPSGPETPSVLHYTSGTTGRPKGAQHVHYSLVVAVPDGEVGARPAARRHLLVQRRSRMGDRHVVRHHRAVVERHDAGRARRRVQRAGAGTASSRRSASPSGTRPPRRSAC